MQLITTKVSQLLSGLAASVLLLASHASLADNVVSLAAGPTTTTLPDGQVVPMWGFTCTGLATAQAAQPRTRTQVRPGRR
jgi:hypothetical protein